MTDTVVTHTGLVDTAAAAPAHSTQVATALPDPPRAPVLGARPTVPVRAVDASAHVVQFYESDACLLDAVGAFIGAALRAGDAGVVLATPAHRAGLEARLQAAGVDVATARARGQYVPLDAAATLSQFMVDGAPDPRCFVEGVGGIITRAATGGRRVRIFGEMVALLAVAGHHAAAIRLEQLWNDLQTTHPCSLFCAYPMDRLGGETLAELLSSVCAVHAHVIPAESYTALPTADDRLRAIAMLQQKAQWLEAEVAERKRAEAERDRLLVREREDRERLEVALEAGRMGTWDWDARTDRVSWSPQLERIHGLAPGTFAGTFAAYCADVHPDDRDRVQATIAAALEHGEHHVEYRIVWPDGSVHWVEARGRVVRDAAGRPAGMRGICMDVTARKQADEVRHRLAAIVESSEDAIIGKTLDAVITDWNAGAERMYGYTAAEAVGQSIAMLAPADRPDELPALMARLRRGERIAHFETERVRKDGTRLAVALTISPIRDAADTVIGASTIARDITDRKQAEADRERLLAQEQAARAEAEGALRVRDALVSFATHDLRTPLTTIKGQAQLLGRLAARDRLTPVALTGGLAGIDAASGTMDALIGELLDTVRLQAGQQLDLRPQPTDLVAVAQRCVAEQQQTTHRHTMRVETRVATLVGEWDPVRVERVLTNLLTNAVKYSPEGGTITVTVGQRRQGRGMWAELAVQDEGLGIPAGDLPHVFEWFHRAANVAGRIAGSGIGLAGARQVVEQHGGTLTVASTEGAGSAFTVCLPLT
jgi:PAS domain S-box-containing protein